MKRIKLAFKTPAKINLGLHIHRKREDGYHELETLLQMVTLYDDVVLYALPVGIELECDAPDIPSDSSNLAYRAALLLQESWPDRTKGVRIQLTKKIPAGAGLGGGSGNAAGVLMGLNVLWDLKMRPADLLPLARELGSDVPFFLTSPCALGKGRGEILTSVQPAEKFYVLLVCPRFSIATSWAYKCLKLKLTKRKNNISILQNFVSQSSIADLGAGLYNDLEPVVIKRYPEVQDIKDLLRAQHAKGVLLSGSGSAVYGIFDDPEIAKRAYAGLQGKSWKLFLTETVAGFSDFLPGEILDYP